jgi:hypothetical protein
MDNWQYLVNTVGDLRFRRNDPDTISRVLEALSYVFEEKGEKEALVLMEQARDLRANPTVVSRPPEEVGEGDDDDGEGDDGEGDEAWHRSIATPWDEREHRSATGSPEEGSFDDLVRNLRWFMEKLK